MSKYIGIFVFVFSLFSLGVHAGESFRFRVYLKDKGDSGYTLDNPEEYLSKESVERRNRQGISVSESDLPIAQAYLDTLSANGGKPVLESKWFSTVVVSSPDSLVAERLLRLPIVDSVKWVWKGDEEIDIPREEKDTTRFMPIDKPEKSPYGYAEEQIKMLNGIKLHEAGFKGKGMRVAVVDAGFMNVDRISVFDSLRLLGTHNVVFPGRSVFIGDDHGTKVLSCLAADAPGLMVGTAPQAEYWLIKSEDSRSEFPIEEDYWTAAMEFADSVGVDVVSSSLGYFSFDVEALNYHQDQLDGRTSLISRAAKMASSKGILLFSSAGNEGGGSWGKITFPADAPDILTVGAITDRKKKSNFSSVGFTADYRVKPDVVALGTGCCVMCTKLINKSVNMRPNLNNLSGEKEALSLLELNTRIRGALSRAFPETCWVRAEMSDVRVNTSSGHCYLEFVEKNVQTGQLVAKVRGSIWAKTFRMLKPYFEMETGQMFASGLKVLVKVSVEFHELYGLSLTVLDIDPAYTLGDMVRKRMEIIRQLQEEGVFTLNKELPFPLLPRRIAIITSPTAAGYEDFMNQLTRNKGGYPFYTKLFPALMQGERTEASVIAALDRIYQHQDLFDVVVIIRGGGATSDLNSFDSYLLAANCAQFPLPIITGIGHERDDTVVDLVAHTRMKTPTAVAEFLISRMDSVGEELESLRQDVSLLAMDILSRQKNYLQLVATRFPSIVTSRIERNRSGLQTIASRLPAMASGLLSRRQSVLENTELRLRNGITSKLSESGRFIQLTEQFIKMASPDYILKRGYSLALKDGKIIKHASDLRAGEELTTRFIDGEIKSIIKP